MSCIVPILLTLFLSISSALTALELKPWFSPMFEPQARAEPRFQFFRFVDTERGFKKYSSTDYFLDLELYSTLWQNWSVELEGMLAATRHRSFGFDSLSLTGRYLWWDDVVGDPLSVTTGLTLYKVFKPSRHDLAIFHHGGVECELHVAAGKEFSCQHYWLSRAWVVGGVGFGDSGSPWLRLDAHWEHNCWDAHHLRFSLCSLWGMGTRSLKQVRHFHGYGPIQHQTVDAGLQYSWIFAHEISLSAAYFFRLYACNAPVYASTLLFKLDYPISL